MIWQNQKKKLLYKVDVTYVYENYMNVCMIECMCLCTKFYYDFYIVVVTIKKKLSIQIYIQIVQIVLCLKL